MVRVRIALAISIVLNLFVAGALVAGYASLRTGGRMINAGSLRIAGAELPASVRGPFRFALRETRRSMRPKIVEARAAKARAAFMLGQPVVDQAAVLTALDRARAADMEVRAALERRAVMFAATLPAAERAKLANAMRRRANRLPNNAR